VVRSRGTIVLGGTAAGTVAAAVVALDARFVRAVPVPKGLSSDCIWRRFASISWPRRQQSRSKGFAGGGTARLHGGYCRRRDRRRRVCPCSQERRVAYNLFDIFVERLSGAIPACSTSKAWRCSYGLILEETSHPSARTRVWLSGLSICFARSASIEYRWNGFRLRCGLAVCPRRSLPVPHQEPSGQEAGVSLALLAPDAVASAFRLRTGFECSLQMSS